jgi:hypothetical protein
MDPESTSPKPIPRHELIAAALELGIERPESLSEAELTEAIQSVSEGGNRAAGSWPSSGWLGVARHLIASVVEQGLNLPTAARAIRDSVRPRSGPPQRPPLPTVTLAQIYIAQGHTERARATLEQVLRRDSLHPKARLLLAELGARAEERTRDTPLPRSVSDEDPSREDPEQGAASSEPELRIAIRPQAAAASPEPAIADSGLSPVADGAPLADALVVLREALVAILYWEIGTRGADCQRKGHALQLRVSTVTPSRGGAVVAERVLDVAEATGSITLDCQADDVVRGALGVNRGERWVPLSVASSHRIVDDGAGLKPEFRPRRWQLDAEVAERARRRALEDTHRQR